MKRRGCDETLRVRLVWLAVATAGAVVISACGATSRTTGRGADAGDAAGREAGQSGERGEGERGASEKGEGERRAVASRWALKECPGGKPLPEEAYGFCKGEMADRAEMIVINEGATRVTLRLTAVNGAGAGDAGEDVVEIEAGATVRLQLPAGGYGYALEREVKAGDGGEVERDVVTGRRVVKGGRGYRWRLTPGQVVRDTEGTGGISRESEQVLRGSTTTESVGGEEENAPKAEPGGSAQHKEGGP